MKFAIAGVASLAFAGSAFAAVPSMSVEKKAGAKATYQIELAGGPSRSRGSISEGNSSGQNRSGNSVDLGRPYLEDIHDIDRERATVGGFDDASDTRRRLE